MLMKFSPYLSQDFKHFQVNNFEILEIWNWDYAEYLAFIKKIIPLIKSGEQSPLIIITSHPHCFTHGTGLQRDTEQQLQEFDKNMLPDFPLYQIKRGGGLTFHHPGQIIIYPLLEITKFKTSITKLMIKMLQVLKESLEEVFDLANLSYKNKLLGLWDQEQGKKLASIGMGLERFISVHGLALNFFDDQKMTEALKKVFPCGISAGSYQSIQELTNNNQLETLKSVLINKFIQEFISKV
jgi:lipoate-protein ligase B